MTLKLGVLQFFGWPDRSVPIAEVYRRAFERIEAMDSGGWDAVWLAEHHFSSYSVCPAIHVMGAHVAARTRRLRIGTGVSLAPFYDPLRLAEEVALLDVLSGGRVNWGVGRGFEPSEFAHFGVPLSDSYAIFREHVAVVLEAWKSERLTFHGEHVSYDGVEVLPRPLQQPHPPVWLAASSPEAMTWAGEQGHSIMLDPHSPHDVIGRKWEFYRDALAAHGHSIEGRDIPMARLLVCAETRAEVDALAERGARWVVESQLKLDRRKKGGGPGHAQSALNERHRDLSMEAAFADLDDPVRHYIDHVCIAGTPAELVDRIHQLREDMHLNYLLCNPLSQSSFYTFHDQVLPKLL